jgi:hypothetical protein
MSKATELVSKLMEEGPDDLNPKREIMRLPDNAFTLDPADYQSDDDPEYVWRKELVDQLNRLSSLATELGQSGRREEAEDLDSIISRVAEFESIQAANR